MMTFRKILVLVMTISILASPMVSSAEELVSGRYLDLGGDNVKVELTIGTPAPASIILIQNFPIGAKITFSEPQLKKYSPTDGKAKWLLSNVKPGKIMVSVILDRSVAEKEIRGEIRYRDIDGKMVTATLHK